MTIAFSCRFDLFPILSALRYLRSPSTPSRPYTMVHATYTRRVGVVPCVRCGVRCAAGHARCDHERC